MADPAELDDVSTEELRARAFTLARSRRDIKFFWGLIELLPHADDAQMLDTSSGSIGAAIDDAVGLWREFTGHSYGNQEPAIRVAFIDYLMKHNADTAGTADTARQ